MNVSELVPIPNGRNQFNFRNLLFLPNYSGCYILTDFEGNILYIGLAENIKNRISQHLENPEKKKVTKEGKVVWVFYIQYDKINLPKLERTWLNQFSNLHGSLPVLNKVNSPIT